MADKGKSSPSCKHRRIALLGMRGPNNSLNILIKRTLLFTWKMFYFFLKLQRWRKNVDIFFTWYCRLIMQYIVVVVCLSFRYEALVPGSINYALEYRDRIYICESREKLEKFLR